MSKMRSGFLKLFPSCTAVFLLSLSTHAEAEQPPPAPEKAAEDTAPVNAASQSHTEATDLRLRPGNSTTNLGEAVPGLISAQHMGGGDADQWFLRGFNAGHGTDVAFFVDGVPVNAVSHGHGQGYSDLHFLIPELTTSVDGYKGSYETRFGDFATAGAVDIKLAEAPPESFAQVSLGQYGMLRGVAIASPQLHDRWRTTLAAEIAKENGPYQTEEDLKRYNAFLRASYDMGARSKVTMTLMSYGSDWNAPGQIPARAVCDEGELGVRSPQSYGQPCIDRFGSADPTQGGKAHRHMASVAYEAHTHHSDLSSQAYIVRSNSDLFSNYTYFENDPINGDQIEQKDDRTMVGSALGWDYHYQLGPAHMTASLGLQFRADAINNALYHDAAQVRLLTVTDDKLNERAIGLYAQEEMKLSRALRFILGARGDHLDVGSRDAARFSPKFVGVLSPIEQLDVFVDYGWGFHSNDARGVFAPPNRANLITPTVSYEAGLRIKPDPSFQLSLAGFVINSRGETVYREDTATNESVPATRRYGVEAQALYHGKSGFFADAAAALSKERYRNDPANADSMTPAPTKTVSAGAGFSRAFGSYTPFVAVRGKLVAEHPATPDQRLYAQGYGTLDADAGLRWWNLEARLDMQNILGAQWRQVSSAATTQLGYESSPVNGVVYSVGAPRTVMGSLRFYWQ